MALTIAVGFVVDDAIVMLENITRYIEEGDTPLHAAYRGSREIAFTIVSISVSLIAVLIPLLLMGGIIGRLFREFAVTLAMTIVMSALISLTLTPMMASRFLKPAKEAHHGKLFAWSERAFDALLHAYERGLDSSLRGPPPQSPHRPRAVSRIRPDAQHTDGTGYRCLSDRSTLNKFVVGHATCCERSRPPAVVAAARVAQRTRPLVSSSHRAARIPPPRC